MSFHKALRPASDSVSATLTPGDQNRGWQRRWIECERALDNLIAPHHEALSADVIHAARNVLHAFYIQTYHLKDALILDAPTTGTAGDAVETAISDDPDLALLADLANLEKHGKLTDVIHKDRAAGIWCENATLLTGVPWAYVKIPQVAYTKLQP